MLGLLLQAACICGSSWLLWKILRQYLVKSVLDNLPGPPSPSLIKGTFAILREAHSTDKCLSGHMERLFHKNEGWKMHDELGNKYSPVARIKGFLGVSSDSK